MGLQGLIFAPYYESYVKTVLGFENFNEALKQQAIETIIFFKNMPEDKLEFRYKEGKWTPKDILLHLIDAERIFAYRALRFARNDKTELPGFEENDYVILAKANLRTIESLLEEYQTVRKATIELFKNWNEEELSRVGMASNNLISVKAIAYIILGHEKHHISIIEERYL